MECFESRFVHLYGPYVTHRASDDRLSLDFVWTLQPEKTGRRDSSTAPAAIWTYVYAYASAAGELENADVAVA